MNKLFSSIDSDSMMFEKLLEFVVFFDKFLEVIASRSLYFCRGITGDGSLSKTFSMSTLVF